MRTNNERASCAGMGFFRIPIWIMASLSIGTACIAQKVAKPLEVAVFHPLYVLSSQEMDLQFYLYNRSAVEQSYTGVVADESGDLVLSGDWKLCLEEVKKGEVVSTRTLGPAQKPEATRTELEPNGYTNWQVRIAVTQLVDHPGNYRFRLGLGDCATTGRLFRVVDKPCMPEDISLVYAPGKNSYFIGEPIAVHFTMKNNGDDEFHFEEGGDYRGANRHLRYAFTAQTADGKTAVDPKPFQPCMGGMGMGDPHLMPGETYEKELPLLAYLKFTEAGTYTITCFQSLGFGMPEQPMPEAGHYKYAPGGSFDIELRLPSQSEIDGHLKTCLAGNDRQALSGLYQECYLEPLVGLVCSERDPLRIEALFDGIASIMTVKATHALIDLAQSARESVRVDALKRLTWRLPDPRDAGRVSPDSPFRLYSSDARRLDSKASWDSTCHAEVLEILKSGLRSKSMDEVSVCAYCLGALAETNTVGLLAEAADRIAPGIDVSAEQEACVAQIANAASLLARLGARPCMADRESSPGRLAVWAAMIITQKEYRTGDWEDLILHMQNLDCPITRMAAIRWLPEDFSKRELIPWEKLFLEDNGQIWWHAIQIARQKFPPGLEDIVAECMKETSDDRKKSELENLIKEIEKSSRTAPSEP